MFPEIAENELEKLGARHTAREIAGQPELWLKTYHFLTIVQNELADLSLIIQQDLRKMGYSIPEAQLGQIIQVGTPNHLRFISNLNIDRDYYAGMHGNLHTDATPDTIDYSVTP